MPLRSESCAGATRSRLRRCRGDIGNARLRDDPGACRTAAARLACGRRPSRSRARRSSSVACRPKICSAAAPWRRRDEARTGRRGCRFDRDRKAPSRRRLRRYVAGRRGAIANVRVERATDCSSNCARKVSRFGFRGLGVRCRRTRRSAVPPRSRAPRSEPSRGAVADGHDGAGLARALAVPEAGLLRVLNVWPKTGGWRTARDTLRRRSWSHPSRTAA